MGTCPANTMLHIMWRWDFASLSAELKTSQVGEGEDDADFKKLLCQYKHVVTQRLRSLKA